MILIKEQRTKKVVGETSLFVSFPYRAEYVNICKSCSGSNYNKKDKEWEIPISYLSYLVDRFVDYDKVELQCLQDKAVTRSPQEKFDKSLIKTTLYDYQLDGVNYGLNHSSWLLLDQPGLGKTAQMLSLASQLKADGKIEHCLVICGLNILKFNWKDEVYKHTYLDSVILGEKRTKTGKLIIGSVADRVKHLKSKIDQFFVITNIETIRSKEIVDAILNGPNKFDMIVFDEAHKLKDSHSQAAKSMLKMTQAKYKIALTGTLLLNNPLDAYVALRWIGQERSTQSNFEYYYTNYGGAFGNTLIGYKNIDFLKDTLSKCSLRRTKDLLNLPPKTVITEYVEMEDTQRTFYNNIKKGVKDQVDKVKLTTANLLAIVTRLRQATACPSILTTEKIASAKQDRCCDLVEQIVSSGEKVVIYSTFKQTLDELRIELKQYNPLLCIGGMSEQEIFDNKEKFQTDDNYKVFMATWQKGGTGITLTAANNVIFIDTPWTDADMLQSSDRVHRIGQEKPVIVYNLVTRDTIDERVLQLVTDKGAISRYIIDDEIPDNAIESLKKYIQEL